MWSWVRAAARTVSDVRATVVHRPPVVSHAEAALMAILAVALIAASAIYGVRKGMHAVFPGPMDTRAYQIASAISDTAYGLDLKRAVQAQVLSSLIKGGMSDIPENFRPLGLTYPEYMRDVGHWNGLLQKTASLQGIGPRPQMSDRTLTFILPEDLGLVDFFKVSFRLFGYEIGGFFKLYFLLLAFSVVFVFVAFWTRPGVLIATNAVLLGLFVSVCIVDNPNNGLFTVANGRFLSTLALVPALHLAILLWAPPRATIAGVASAIIQALFLGFVISMRSSANWAMVFLVASIAMGTLLACRRCWPAEPVSRLARETLTWPVVVVALCIGAFNAYQHRNTHPAYFALDETLPRHYFWGALAAGLGLGELDAVLPAIDGVRGDALGTQLGNVYLDKIMGYKAPTISAYYASNPFPELGRQKTYERLVQAAFLDFAASHPGYMLQLTLVTKPRLLLRTYYDAYARALKRNLGFLAAVVLMFAAAVAIVRRTGSSEQDLRFSALVIAGLLLSSLLPSVAVYPALLAMGDGFALAAALAAAAGLALRLLGSMPLANPGRASG